MQSEALNVINDLKLDMTASPVDDVTIITRAQLEALEAALSAAEQQPAPFVAVKASPEALEQFTAYFVKNYPGPDTIIFDPKWHAPKIFRAAVSALSAQVQDVAQERYRHKKRGSIYTVMARGRLQVDGDLDNEKVVVYRGEDGQTWVRPEYEFNDGRFEPLPAAPAKQEGGHD
ncbi:DUF1653 domain-containing protein [Rhizobium rhizogenes]|nr:DUF1653 domain-containing protein [Rhizobium rhizogenes]